MLFNVHPEHYEKIKDNWRPKCNKGKINEVNADTARSNVDLFTNIGTHTKTGILDEVSKGQ